MEPIRPDRTPSLAQLKKSAGFTLLEMLVVLAIITIIMGVVITSQSSFNKSLILANTAYDVGLAIRSAETFGISNRVNGISNAPTNYNFGYGIHFDSTNKQKIILFADTDLSYLGNACHASQSSISNAPDSQIGDCMYHSDAEPAVNTYSLGNGITVSDFCACPIGQTCSSGSNWYCTNSGSTHIAYLDIVFARPNPTPSLRSYSTRSTNTVYTKACITLSSPQGGSPRYIQVLDSGAISVGATSCL